MILYYNNEYYIKLLHPCWSILGPFMTGYKIFNNYTVQNPVLRSVMEVAHYLANGLHLGI